MRKLTISELSEQLGISVQATWKKVKKLIRLNSLTTTKEVVNNRETTFVLLTDEKLNELISTTNVNQPVYQSLNRFNQPNDGVEQQGYSEVVQQVDNQFKNFNYEEIVTRVLDFTENINSEMRDLYREISDKNGQVKLLEDSEGRTKREYQETQAFIRELKEKVAIIEAENNTFKLDIINKNRDIENLTKTITLISSEKELLLEDNNECKMHKSHMTQEIIDLTKTIESYKSNLLISEQQKDLFRNEKQSLEIKVASIEKDNQILNSKIFDLEKVKNIELELQQTQLKSSNDKIADLEIKISNLIEKNKKLNDLYEKKSFFNFLKK